MNCYNSARYLREALESVRSQTYTDWEIVFWDNQSTDESASIFKSFPDQRFRYFLAPEHTILSVAKNLAVAKARGEWLACLDCDDLWEPDKLERQVAIIRQGGPDLGLVYGRIQNIYEDICQEEWSQHQQPSKSSAKICDQSEPPLPEGDIFSRLLQSNFIPQPSVIIRKSYFYAVGGVRSDLIIAWDYDLWLKISKRFRVKAVQETCARYRIHGSSLSQIQREIGPLEVISIVQGYLPDQAAVVALKKCYTHLAVGMLKKMKFGQSLSTLFRHGEISLFLKTVVSSLRSRLF